jgi:hypothetical protein
MGDKNRANRRGIYVLCSSKSPITVARQKHEPYALKKAGERSDNYVEFSVTVKIGRCNPERSSTNIRFDRGLKCAVPIA